MLSNLNDIISAATSLFEFSDRFQEAKEQKRQKIANHFQKIENCLLESIKELTNNNREKHEYYWSKLKFYAESLPEIIGEVIGHDKAEEISNQLTTAIGDNPSDDINIKQLNILAGIFSVLADNVTVNRSPRRTFQRNRRTFLSTAVGASVGLTAGFFIPKNFPDIKWKMSTFLGESYKNLILYKAPEMVCNLVAEMTNNKFTIELNRDGDGETETILKNVSKGNIDCGYSGIYYSQDKYKALFFGSAIPFGLNPQEQNAWLYYKQDPNDELTYIQKIYEQIGLNVIPFPAGGTGGQMGGWFTQPVNTIEEFNKLVMRMPGLGGEILDKLDVGIYLERNNGIPMPIKDIKQELKSKNRIQAAEWIGPHDDYQLGLHEVAKYYYYPGWWEPSTTFDVQVNKDKWDQLSAHYKAIFKAACAKTHIKILAKYDNKNADYLKIITELSNENEVKINRFSDDILRQAKEKTQSVLDNNLNPEFMKVYAEWTKFKEKIRPWSNFSNYTQTYELPTDLRPCQINFCPNSFNQFE